MENGKFACEYNARGCQKCRCAAALQRCKMVLHRSALCGMSNARQPKQPPVSALIVLGSHLIVRGGSQRCNKKGGRGGREEGGGERREMRFAYAQGYALCPTRDKLFLALNRKRSVTA